MNTALYETYVQILHEELVPAMGCTEPIAVAYAGALARQTLGTLPERIELTVSGNIIKNVKSVIVPHTGGRKGLPVAVAAGVRVGDAGAQLEVLANVTEDQLPLLDEYLSAAEITVSKSPLRCPFDIQVRVFAGGDTAFVQIVGSHTNVVRIEKNGEVLLNKPFSEEAAQPPESRRSLTVEDIIAFADEVDLDDVRAPIARQIEYNTAIAEAGLTGQYGAAIGKILLDSYGDSVQNRAKAWAAAGSDARMNGCEKPVVINSGSGNQGMTASLPVIVYARELKASEEQLYRALVVSNLVTIHLKTGIGSLSAYCGATSAGAGAGATGATGTDGAGVPPSGAVVWAAKSAGEMTIVSPCTRPVISSCGSSTGIGSGSSSTGMRGVSNLGSCGTGVSGVSNSVGCGRSSVVSALTSCGV